MNSVIAIPIVRVSAKVVFEKGRGWSPLDELVLWALSKKPRPATELAEQANLPRRLVLEIIVRMMRFRLVEAVIIEGALAFQTTIYGDRVIASGSEIPTIKKRLHRRVAFVVDQITETVFPKRDVRINSAHDLKFMREKDIQFTEVNVTGSAIKTTPRENIKRFQDVLREDETFIHFDGDTLVERRDEFMLVTVEGSDIRGLPSKCPSTLIDQILTVSRNINHNRVVNVSSIVEPNSIISNREEISLDVSFDDLVLGGPEHEKLLEEIFKRANRRILIHSTFLRNGAFLKLKSLFRNAVRRGVEIDIFWGAGSASNPNKDTVRQAAEIAKEIGQDSILRGGVTIHLSTTGSHSKLLIADDGDNNFHAVVGSCNWLYTNFDRLELSIKLVDPIAVAAIADQFCTIVAKPQFKVEVGTELYLLTKKLRETNSLGGAHCARVLVGAEHEAILREASGKSSDRFLIASDKLGTSLFPNAVIPAELIAAAEKNTPIIAYGAPSGPVTGTVSTEVTLEAADKGVRLLRISEGFHAKFLLWGNDDVVITSLNWCSAHSDLNNPSSEIGIHIRRTGIADHLYQRLKLRWDHLN